MSKKNKKKFRKPKRFKVIAYFGVDDGKKWRCDNLEKFTQFLDKSHSQWRWFEVYNNSTKEFIKRVLNPIEPQRKYNIIVKLGNDDFKKWQTDDLLNFVEFLDKSHSNWRYFNVFCTSSKNQLSNFTQSNRPTSKIL